MKSRIEGKRQYRILMTYEEAVRSAKKWREIKQIEKEKNNSQKK